MKIFCKMSLQK